jgi:hypothetical protein
VSKFSPDLHRLARLEQDESLGGDLELSLVALEKLAAGEITVDDLSAEGQKQWHEFQAACEAHERRQELKVEHGFEEMQRWLG